MTFRERALALFPAGSNGEYGIPAELVPVLERGEGCRVWNTDGREYLDMTMAWGAALVGHAHPKVIEAATRQAASGANFAALNRRALELAERIQQRVQNRSTVPLAFFDWRRISPFEQYRWPVRSPF